jgi:FkbM family methyltransferase
LRRKDIGVTFVCYAQNFEDVILWRALKHVQNGFYIDIGAQDPRVDSVSLAFYEHGWRGIHVEPVAAFAASLKLARPDEPVLEAVVGDAAGEVTLFEIAGTGLSTADRHVAARQTAAGWPVRSLRTMGIRLCDVLEAHKHRDIHWLKIDVEGAESSVLKSWTPSAVRPWIVVVECIDPITRGDTSATWSEELCTLGYDCVYTDGLNKFFVSHAHPELHEHFGIGPNLFDNFTLAGTQSAPFSKLANAQIAHHLVREAELEAHALQKSVILQELNDEVRALRQQLHLATTTAETTIQTLRNERDLKDSQVQALLKSTSWKLTRPLRQVVNNVKEIKLNAFGWPARSAPLPSRQMARAATVLLAERLLGNHFTRRLSLAALTPFPRIRHRLQSIVASGRISRDHAKRNLPALRNGMTDSRIDPKCPQTGSRVIYIFVGNTVVCPVNTGVQRVARGLSQGFLEECHQIGFVKWDASTRQCVLINRSERQYLACHSGPKTATDVEPIYPLPSDHSVPLRIQETGQKTWLIVPDVLHMTHLEAPDTRELIAWAHQCNLLVGFIFYDAIPLRLDAYANMADAHFRYMTDLSGADALWPISEYSAKDLMAFWQTLPLTGTAVPHLKPILLPAGSARKPSAQALPRERMTILCVGTIEARKNQLALISAFKQCLQRRPDLTLSLVFVGNLNPILAATFKSALNASIHYAGCVDDAELSRLYNDCDFTIFPSSEEGFGLPIVESLWHGKPCICANFGPMGEIARGGGCLAIDVRSTSALSGAIEKLAVDANYRQALAAQAEARLLGTWHDYAHAITASFSNVGSVQDRLGVIYYWIESTIAFPINTGIQRVTRMLARHLIELGLHVVPVKWCRETKQFGPVSADDLAHLACWNGPPVESWAAWREPERSMENSWFVMAELPLDLSAKERSALLDFVASRNLRAAAVFYDTIPWKMRSIYPIEFSSMHKHYMEELIRYQLVIAISQYSKRELLAFFQDSSIIDRDEAVVSLPLPGEFKQHSRVLVADNSGARKEVTILCVGTIEPRKNHEVLLRAFEQAQKFSGIPMKLVLVGSSHSIQPELAQRVRAIVRDNPRINWEENADDKRLHELQSACDFTVYPSVEEGFGLPILESLWYAKPCICADFGAMAEAASGGGCLTVDVRDSAALADAIRFLANDIDARKKLTADATRRPVETWRSYAQTFASILADHATAKNSNQFALPAAEFDDRISSMRLDRYAALSVPSGAQHSEHSGGSDLMMRPSSTASAQVRTLRPNVHA